MLGNQKLAENTSIADRILAEGKRVYDLANECINFAPRSIIVVNVPPVSVTTPIVAGAYQKTHWYHPGRIVGSAALAQVNSGLFELFTLFDNSFSTKDKSPLTCLLQSN